MRLIIVSDPSQQKKLVVAVHSVQPSGTPSGRLAVFRAWDPHPRIDSGQNVEQVFLSVLITIDLDFSSNSADMWLNSFPKQRGIPVTVDVPLGPLGIGPWN